MVFMGPIKAHMELYIFVLGFIKLILDVSVSSVLFLVLNYKLYLNIQASLSMEAVTGVRCRLPMQ
jgi:hypothetical protein